MSAIYLHIPYCKVKCHYCDFHFSTDRRKSNAMASAMQKELSVRKNVMDGILIESVYFGGGTPSLLPTETIAAFLEQIQRNYSVDPCAEITLEANPDDLNSSVLSGFKSAGVNRLSIGIQSFDERVLKWMNRAHSTQQAISSIQDARNCGFENITADLIYGIPKTDNDYWETQLQMLLSFDLPHISAYCLSVEPNTYFGVQRGKGKYVETDDESALREFETMHCALENAGYEHYEISNFGKPGSHSRHNTAYWSGKKYLGIGPSAHSYDGMSRSWNISNNSVYMKKLDVGGDWFESEILTPENRFNEHVMTGLRTKRGINSTNLERLVPDYKRLVGKELDRHLKTGDLLETADGYRLSAMAWFRSDRIASDLFVQRMLPLSYG